MAEPFACEEDAKKSVAHWVKSQKSQKVSNIRIRVVGKYNKRGKPTKTPTARWVFFCFTGIHMLTIEKQIPIVVNLQERHQIILEALGSYYQIYYS